jgi:hypothetical protein
MLPFKLSWFAGVSGYDQLLFDITICKQEPASEILSEAKDLSDASF